MLTSKSIPRIRLQAFIIWKHLVLIFANYNIVSNIKWRVIRILELIYTSVIRCVYKLIFHLVYNFKLFKYCHWASLGVTWSQIVK